MGKAGVNITHIYIVLYFCIKFKQITLTLYSVANNTLLEFNVGGYFDKDVQIYAGKEKVWTDMSAFILPKGSPLMARAKIIITYACTFDNFIL